MRLSAPPSGQGTVAGLKPMTDKSLQISGQSTTRGSHVLRPPLGQGASGGARTHAIRVPAERKWIREISKCPSVENVHYDLMTNS
ncbi:hypothetical protein PoB_001709100 [Plakobranchus ocellatus]|uniref:Uncharacterized protein n=1 Tax=Plakobranchus ocellatus TaxID=259542 RepID=A0AAV3Z403_9GAST|nr:hypothetical protein PoB_001709100 [Plakobranchus ocellatus]